MVRLTHGNSVGLRDFRALDGPPLKEIVARTTRYEDTSSGAPRARHRLPVFKNKICKSFIG